MLSFLTFVLFLFAAARAMNDWSKPCLQGVCSYDLPSTSGSGTVQLSGSSSSISDITPAADWVILSCNPNALAQSVRIVCQGDDTTTACGHLFNHTGAAGKLVRLPENCGRNPFARVANTGVSDDQSIPASIAPRLVRRNGVSPQVHSLDIDTNFSAVDTSKMGVVSISILGSTVPGIQLSVPVTRSRRRRQLHHRNFLSSISETIQNLSNAFDVNQTTPLPPITLDKDFPLLNGTVTCSGKSLSVEADIYTNTNAVVSIGVVASGTIVPPQLSDFALVAGLTATINGTLNFGATATGAIDSGPILLFEVGLPGFDIPGILTLGPSFKVNAQTTATLDLGIDTKIGLSYNVNNAKLFFPPSSNRQSGGDFAPGDTPLAISVSPSISSSGTITTHLIPTIDVGLNALGGLASATIFLDLDASANIELSLNGSTSLNTTVSPDSNLATVPSHTASPNTGVSSLTASAVSNVKRHAKRASMSNYSRLTSRDGVTAGPIDVIGCVDVGTELSVNAGAEGNFFDIFTASTQVPLFDKKFDLFKQCLGMSLNNKREMYRPSQGRSSVVSRRSALTCPGAGITDAIAVVDELVSAASIIAL